MSIASSPRSSHEWISRFCVQVIRTRPGISLPSAVHRAVAAYPYTQDLEPEDAAAMALDRRRAPSPWTPLRTRFGAGAERRRG